MSDIDLVVLPTMLVCTFVSGFLLNCCPSRYNNSRINELELQQDELEWQISRLQKLLEDANSKLLSKDTDENKDE